MPKRKGQVRLRDVSLDLIALLNRGETESATLTEQVGVGPGVAMELPGEPCLLLYCEAGAEKLER